MKRSCVYIELLNSSFIEPKEEEVKNHNGIWVKKEKVKDFINLQEPKIHWDILQNGEKPFIGYGIAINSEQFNNLETSEFKIKITKWLEENNLGKKAINYKLRDWVFSRQHYWGEPIPIVKCEKCGNIALEKKDLPLELPDVKNYEPTDTGKSPLAKIDQWVNIKCPKCNSNAKRETDTMPNWAGSSWYFLRYIDSKNNKEFASPEKLKYWMPVDLYNGGMEHTTLHLLYSRFWHKFLYDLGYVNTSEPYKIRRSHGMILAEDGQKMSKSRGNVVNPDEVIEKYGADTLRLYEMFMGPYGDAIPWSTSSLIGMNRFLEKIWKMQNKVGTQNFVSANKNIETLLHQTIKKVTEDIENLKFNTAISSLMILLNGLDKKEKISNIQYSIFLIMLSPFAPHITEELWKMFENKESIHLQKWPEYNEKLAEETEITLVIQINGKVRDQIEVPADISEEEAKKIALGRDKIKKWTEGKEMRKIIFVKGKLVNVVV
ncbi:MAG: class I tRNA ligase family protein [Candidatus Pacebacteria bacterium]|nr:class I tRNA ligase family protein [Candidatus Paceibacterota bacterium]